MADEPKYQIGQRVYMRESEVEITAVVRRPSHWPYPLYHATHEGKPWGWYAENRLTIEPPKE